MSDNKQVRHIFSICNFCILVGYLIIGVFFFPLQETFGALVANPTPVMQTGYFGGYSNEQVYAHKSE
jgi:hypothetical protein